MRRKLRTLLFSTLYPSSVRPRHGIFVETRLRKLLDSGEIECKVVAPVPWFFSSHTRFGDYALHARTPRREMHNGVDVLHPRYLLPPKVGMNLAPLVLAGGALPALRRVRAEGFDFDLIDAHYCYPDGVAAALMARHLGKPFTMTARGSDLNLLPNYRLPRASMQWAARRADACIAVSSALVDILRGWQVDADRLHVMRNGVDLDRFSPSPREEERRVLRLDGSPILLSVGNLLELKGHDIVIDALARLLPRHPDAKLVVIGEGPDRARLERRVTELGLDQRVMFKAHTDQRELARWYSAADILILASSREGLANVLLEAMACGTPVIATAVGGSPEIIDDDAVGNLVARDPDAVAAAVQALLVRKPDRAVVRAHAQRFGWETTTRAQLSLFNELSRKHPCSSR
jgi:glycosyltransferase involved in cell wall biosynthesis